MGDILNINRHIIIDFNDGVFNIRNVFQKAKAADDILDFIDLNGSCTHIHIGHLDRIEHIFDVDTVGPHSIGIDIDLVLFFKAAD